jgi:hypothetical protein
MSGQTSPEDYVHSPQKPTRVSLSLGRTTQLNEFDFSKISLSLERDLVPTENPIDAYRDIKALLERMVTEFQAGRSSQIPNALGKSSPNIKFAAKTQQTGNGAPSLQASKPAGLTVETLLERLAKWADKVEVTSTLNGFAVRPRHFLLRQTWVEVDTCLRDLGAKWVPAVKGVGSWIVPS